MSINYQNTDEVPPAYFAPDLRRVLNDIRRYLVYLFRQWKVILIIVTIAGTIGVGYAWLQKPKYESSLTFALEESGGGGLSGALSLAAEFGLNLGGSKSIFAGDNILQIISSRRVIENVLLSIDSSKSGSPLTLAQQFLEIQRADKSPDPKSRMDQVSFPAGKPRNTFTYLEDSVLFVMYQEHILSSLIAHRPDKKLGIFEVRFTSLEERFSKVFTEKLMDETIDFYTELRSSKSRQTLQILEERVASLKGDVKSSISNRTSIQDANLNPAFAKAQAPLQQRQFDISAYGAAYTELFKNLELARYQFLQDVPLLQIIDRPDFPLKRIKIGRLFTGLLFAMIAGILVVLFYSLKFKLQSKPEN